MKRGEYSEALAAKLLKGVHMPKAHKGDVYLPFKGDWVEVKDVRLDSSAPLRIRSADLSRNSGYDQVMIFVYVDHGLDSIYLIPANKIEKKRIIVPFDLEQFKYKKHLYFKYGEHRIQVVPEGLPERDFYMRDFFAR